MAMAGCAEQLLPIANQESLTAWFNIWRYTQLSEEEKSNSIEA